jgi:hypothetical protein
MIILVLVFAVALIVFYTFMGRATIPTQAIPLLWDHNWLPMLDVSLLTPHAKDEITCCADSGSSDILIASCDCKSCDNATCSSHSVGGAEVSFRIKYSSQHDDVKQINASVCLAGTVCAHNRKVMITENRTQSDLKDTSHYNIIGLGPKSQYLTPGDSDVVIFSLSATAPYLELCSGDKEALEERVTGAKYFPRVPDSKYVETPPAVRFPGCDDAIVFIFDTGSNFTYHNTQCLGVQTRTCSITGILFRPEECLAQKDLAAGHVVVGTLALRDRVLAYSVRELWAALG